MNFLNNLEARSILFHAIAIGTGNANKRSQASSSLRPFCSVHMAAKIYAHILCVFEGILNKAGGIH